MMKPLRLVAAAAALCASPCAGAAVDAAVHQTTVPAFLPYYDKRFWGPVMGQVVSTSADVTYYSIFCPPRNPPACDVALEFPFIFGESPHTLKFSGTLTSTFINTLECKLAGTTAATCSGYSSLAAGYTNGKHAGPTEVHWTSTLTGKDVQWGTLTLTDDASTTDTLDITATIDTPDATPVAGHTVSTRTGSNGLPIQTGTSGASRVGGMLALVVTGSAMVMASLC